jgi:amidohydrolase
MENIKTFIQAKAKSLFEKVNSYRQHIHANPELSYEEFETMKFVSKTLTELGIPHQKNVGKTGVVALIKGERHASMNNCIALRSDLDALPIQEENEVPYKSKKQGIMHACGHDVHTSILLGVAELLNEIKEELPQPVKLIFQPGEEKNPGGATLMLADGVLENPKVEKMYALHVFPDLEAGKIGFREGLYMASCDEIYITVEGKGGHGAMPHQTIDPIVIGSTIVTSLQQIVSRKCDPTIPCVLSFGHFEALGATNVIPSQAILKGTFRTMNETWRAKALEEIKTQANLIAESFGGTAKVEISHGYPYLENNPQVTAELRSKAIEYLGKDNVIELPIRMTSEDFAYYSQEVPVCFFRLGVRNEEHGIVYGVHHPKFNIDEQALITGIEIMSLSAIEKL